MSRLTSWAVADKADLEEAHEAGWGEDWTSFMAISPKHAARLATEHAYNATAGECTKLDLVVRAPDGRRWVFMGCEVVLEPRTYVPPGHMITRST